MGTYVANFDFSRVRIETKVNASAIAEFGVPFE